LFGWLVSDAVEVLAVQIGERGAVAGMAEEEVKHGQRFLSKNGPEREKFSDP
jgi:hypothetical protein